MTFAGTPVDVPDFDTSEYYSWRVSVTAQTLHWFIGMDQENHIDRFRRLLAGIDFMDVSRLTDQVVLKRTAMLIQDGRIAVVNSSSGLGPDIRFLSASDARWYVGNTRKNGSGVAGAAALKTREKTPKQEDGTAAKDNVANRNVTTGNVTAREESVVVAANTKTAAVIAAGAASAAMATNQRREHLEIEFFYRPNVLSQTVTRPVLETGHSINGPEQDAWGEGKKYSRLPSYLVWAGDYELAFNPFNQRPRTLKQK